MEPKITITLNGFPEEVPEGSTVARLLEMTGEGHTEMIAEVNGRFVHPRDYAGTVVPAGARVEFIYAAFGG